MIHRSKQRERNQPTYCLKRICQLKNNVVFQRLLTNACTVNRYCYCQSTFIGNRRWKPNTRGEIRLFVKGTFGREKTSDLV